MTTARMETAADKYAELKQKRFEDWLATTFTDEALKGVDLFEVKCPSGMPFKCRKLKKEYIENTGQLPMILSGQMALAMQNQKPTKEEARAQFAAMSAEEQFATRQATAQMIRYCVVEPRLVIQMNGNKNALPVDALTMEDFGYLADWVTGGDAAEGLKTFRRKRK